VLDDDGCLPGLTAGAAPLPQAEAGGWIPLAPGIAYTSRRFDDPPPTAGCARLDVVRVDPAVAPLRARLRAPGAPLATAMQHCADASAVAAINLGMFETDFATHTGYARDGDVVNNPRWASAYSSLLVWRPGAAALIDGSDASAAAGWTSAVQNLRLIRSPGVSVWKPNAKRWSEAAIAQDRQGNLLLLHTRAAFEMAEFNTRLLALDLDVVRAQHVEGGPEASLAVCAPTARLEAAGSLETDFFDDSNLDAWPLPNVLLVGQRAVAQPAD
jgi:hypothetical protein